MNMTKNQKSIGVPGQVHAQVAGLAKRDHLKIWEIVAEGARLYGLLNQPGSRAGDNDANS